MYVKLSLTNFIWLTPNVPMERKSLFLILFYQPDVLTGRVFSSFVPLERLVGRKNKHMQ